MQINFRRFCTISGAIGHRGHTTWFYLDVVWFRSQSQCRFRIRCASSLGQWACANITKATFLSRGLKAWHGYGQQQIAGGRQRIAGDV